MAEAQEGSNSKEKAEVVQVAMEDGRTVGFPGKRKVQKATIVDESKIQIDEAGVYLGTGAVAIRMDFRNGSTRLIPLPNSLVPKFAGHGGEQKFGDNLATKATEPMSEEEMVLATETLAGRVNEGEWGVARDSGDSFAGAGIVMRALAEASGKPIDFVKEFLQKKLDESKASVKEGEKPLSRAALYASFRNPNSKTGQIIARMEQEKAAKESKVDADEALAELGA